MRPIYDLHCDLLGCVAADEKALTFESREIRCSLPQLLEGGVLFQTFAVAVVGEKGSTKKAERQVELYEDLLKRLGTLQGILAIENASGLAEEDEPLESAFARLEAFLTVERILYISLTWNGENRFGGGNASTVGLKPDGEALLEYISGKGIAIDLSHTSDALAHDLLNLIDKRALKVPVIASHSNYRAIQDHPRNLPDEIAREIIARGGLIGLNFVRCFVGEHPADFLRHLEHGVKLGGEDVIAMGADFYGGFEMPPEFLKELSFPTFQPGFDNSSCYPHLFPLLGAEFSDEQLDKWAHRNVLGHLQKITSHKLVHRRKTMH